jgi:hypothetical protein
MGKYNNIFMHIWEKHLYEWHEMTNKPETENLWK